jgi:hypothetical protein
MLCLVSAAGARLPLVDHLVGQFTVEDYTDCQQTIEDMGLGYYGGAQYDQTYRGRDAGETGWIGSLGNQEARLYLAEQFAALGLTVTVQGTYHNVVAELPGVETPERIFIVGAHYDTTKGAPRPGGDDNASGTAAVVHIARILSQYRFRSTIRFIGFNAEEYGLLGSSNYVSTVVQPGHEDVRGMISLDMILRPFNDANPALPWDADLGCPPSADDLAWVDMFVASGGEYVPALPIDPATPFTSNWGSSDHQPFANAGYASFLAIENSVSEIRAGSNAYYHSAEDWSGGGAGAEYDYFFATAVAKAVAATLAQAAEILPEPLEVSSATDWDWVYQNTPLVTQDRHRILLTISVDEDLNGNTSYTTLVTQSAGPGDVKPVETADPMVWKVLGGRRGEGAVGAATLDVRVGGEPYGGEGSASAAVTVRPLGDIDGNTLVNALDKLQLNLRLNGVTTAHPERAFDLDGDGAVSGSDKLQMNRILNTVPVP